MAGIPENLAATAEGLDLHLPSSSQAQLVHRHLARISFIMWAGEVMLSVVTRPGCRQQGHAQQGGLSYPQSRC